MILTVRLPSTNDAANGIDEWALQVEALKLEQMSVASCMQF